MDTVEPNGRSKKVDRSNTLGTVDTLEKIVQVEIVDTEGRTVYTGGYTGGYSGTQWGTNRHSGRNSGHS
jgi:hypothetical protein